MRILLSLLVLTTNLFSYEMVVRTPQNDLEIIDIHPDQNFEDVLEQIQYQYGSHELCLCMTAGKPEGENVKYRNYNAPLTSKEKSDIKYIVNTLGMEALTSIAKQKSSLKKAGDRIRHIHPLKFLTCVFTDQEMIVSITAMQSRGWVWGDFFDGIKESLNEERGRNNMKEEFVFDFAKKISIDASLIHSQVMHGKWDDFMNTLIKHVPRTGETDRYDM